MENLNRTYGHILWDEFASKFNTQAKIKELAEMFPYSSAPRDWFDRKEIIKAGLLVRAWNWIAGGDDEKHIKTRYIRFEELQDWTPEQIVFAESHGITMDGNSEQHAAWLNEYEAIWIGDDENAI